MDKEIKMTKIDDKLDLIALDDEVEEYQSFFKCGKKGCSGKTVIQLKLPETIEGLRVEGLYPLCRNHLEEFYKDGYFDELKDINHLNMIEGIIKFGTFEKWMDSKELATKSNQERWKEE